MAMIQMLIQRRLDRRHFKGPSAPDPTAVANAQTAANIGAADKEAQINRYDQVSPFGNTTWANDNGKWKSTFQLDPSIQGMLDQYRASANAPQTPVTTDGLQTVASGDTYRVNSDKNYNFGANDASIANSAGLASSSAGLAGSQIDRLKKLYAQDFNYDNLKNKIPTADNASRQAVEDAYYSRSQSRLDPQYQQAEQEMRSRLANQGITEGSEAYNRELDQLGRVRNDAYAGARNDAITNSTTELGKLFNMGLAGRQQEVGEANYLRALPTQEAQAAAGLYGGYNQALNNDLGTQTQLRRTAKDTAVQDAAMDQQLRGNGLNERLTLDNQRNQSRQQLLNELIGMTTGSQLTGGGAGQVKVDPAPVAQSIYNTYQGQQAASAAKNSNLTQGLGTAASVAAMAFMAF